MRPVTAYPTKAATETVKGLRSAICCGPSQLIPQKQRLKHHLIVLDHWSVFLPSQLIPQKQRLKLVMGIIIGGVLTVTAYPTKAATETPLWRRPWQRPLPPSQLIPQKQRLKRIEARLYISGKYPVTAYPTKAATETVIACQALQITDRHSLSHKSSD